MPRQKGKKNSIRFKNSEDMRKFLLKVLNDYHEGKITDTQVKTFVSLVECFASLFEEKIPYGC